MSLRITEIASDEGTRLRIDGRLEAELVGELQRVCETAQSPLTLNLEGVMWVDDRATTCLLRLKSRGAKLICASPYIALRLRSKEKGLIADSGMTD